MSIQNFTFSGKRLDFFQINYPIAGCIAEIMVYSLKRKAQVNLSKRPSKKLVLCMIQIYYKPKA